MPAVAAAGTGLAHGAGAGGGMGAVAGAVRADHDQSAAGAAAAAYWGTTPGGMAIIGWGEGCWTASICWSQRSYSAFRGGSSRHTRAAANSLRINWATSA